MRSSKILWPAMALIVSSCGGGLYGGNTTAATGTIDTSGSDVPVTFAGPVDAAKAAAVIASLIVPSGPIAGGGSGKSTTTTPCASGGSVTFTTDDSTSFPNDGRHVYDQCTTTVGSDLLIQNGVSSDHCNATSSDGTACINDFLTAGEGNSPTTIEQKSSTRDVIVRLLSTDIEAHDGATVTDRNNGALERENLLSHQSLAMLSNQLTISVTTNSGGGESASAGGTFGLNDAARSTANCISGRLTVSTPVTLMLDNNENFTGGQLHFTSDSGSTGDVVFQSGGVSVSINGGAPMFFNNTVLQTYCTVN